jgi:hypothetical protein
MMCHQKCPGSAHPNFTDALLLAIKENPGIAYLCPACEGSKTRVFELYRDFDRFKSELRKEFDDLKASLLSERRDPVSDNDPIVPANIPGFSLIQEEVKEALAKEKKKLNAVIVGLPENDVSSARSQVDMNFVNDIFAKLQIDRSELKDVFRDGKVREATGDRPFCRIIKVKFESWHAKMTFLRGFKGSIPPNFKAYARHDLTLREREEERSLKNLLGEYRDKFRDAQLVINRGRIVYKGTHQVFSPTLHNVQLLAPGRTPPGGLGLAASASQGQQR